jgi:Ca2+-binding RTX toxin-like protein
MAELSLSTLSLSVSNPNPGQVVTISTPLQNSGAAFSSGLRIYYYWSYDSVFNSADYNNLFSWSDVIPSGANYTTTVNAQVQLPSHVTSGSIYLFAVVNDPLVGDLATTLAKETNYTDNRSQGLQVTFNGATADEIAGSTSTYARLAPLAPIFSTINTISDSDWFRVTLTAGHTYQFGMYGYDTDTVLSLRDPYLELRNAAGSLLASDEDGGTGWDAQITYTPTTTGTFYIAASGSSVWGSDPTYRTGTYLIAYDDVTVDDYAQNGSTTGSVLVGNSVAGNIEIADDRDWFAVTLTAGTAYRFDLRGAPTGDGTLADTFLRLRDASGNSITFNDDSGGSLNSSITYTATTTGTHYLSVGSYYPTDTGTYRLYASTVTSGAPLIVVTSGSTEIFDNDSSPSPADGTNFGTVAQGSAAVDHIFRVTNNGTAALTLGTVTLPSGFTLLEPLNTSIAPGGGTDTFTVRMSTATLGTFTGQISFSTNDGTANPFNFSITGTVAPPPDLTASITSLNASSFAPNSAVSVTYLISNGGGVQAGPTNARIFLVNPANNDTWELGTRAIGVIGAGLSVPDTFNGTIPADVPPGTFHIRVEADWLSSITESSEANNISSSYVITVTQPNPFTEGDNVVTLTVPGQTWHALGGADNVTGTSGTDIIYGDNGNDTLDGRGGTDQLYGGIGIDILTGGSGADQLYGGADGDYYYVDSAGDQIVENPNEGLDQVFFTSVSGATLSANVEYGFSLGTTATLTGNSGDNVLIGAYATVVQTLYGGDGNDFLAGTPVGDTLYGGNGIDDLRGFAGNDSMVGGNDNDSYYVEQLGDIVVEAAGTTAGVNDIVDTKVNLTLPANVETLFTYGTATNVTGNDAANAMLAVYSALGVTLDGAGGNDLLYGSNFADSLIGGADNDTMFGDASNGDGLADTLTGGAGNDTYFLKDAGDFAVEAANDGVDVIYTATNRTLPDNFETLFVYGAANSATGNAAANVLIGSYNSTGTTLDGAAGNDTVIGGSAADNIIGGLGADVLTGAGGNDFFRASAGQVNGDAINDFTGNGAAAGDVFIFSGFGAAATLTQIGASQWRITYNGGASTETFTLNNSATIDPSDYAFI